MSTIAAGTTSGTALVSTGNTDGTIQLQVNGTTPALTLATTGAVGVGSTPGYGTSGQVLTSQGSAAAPTWAAVSASNLTRSARTSNTILGTADKGTLITITSGTFTQTFTAAATLGSGWWCYIQNAGTGDITLDPNASETIDGLTSYIMYPNEVRLVQCDGTSFYTVVLQPFYRQITSTMTFVAPPGYTRYGALVWGGGGGGQGGTGATAGGGSVNGGDGGGGGGFSPFLFAAPPAGTSITATVGAGGLGSNGGTGNARGTAPSNGGNSSFGSYAASSGALGGEGGAGGLTSSRGVYSPVFVLVGYGAVSYCVSWGTGGAPAAPRITAYNATGSSEYGGAGGGVGGYGNSTGIQSNNGGRSIFGPTGGGGGGGSSGGSGFAGAAGGGVGYDPGIGYSTGGGAAGGSAGNAGTAGSVLSSPYGSGGGGGGGGSSDSTTGGAGGNGAAPGGGGGGGGSGLTTGGKGGDGGRGEIQVWGIA